MFVIGVTGGIGSGKSSAARLIADRGALLIDADKLSHQATKKGAPALAEIALVFGLSVLREDGSLNREKVSQIVFSDVEKKAALETIVHRHVVDAIDALLAELRGTKQLVVLDVPIPVERGFLDVCDVVLAVVCDDEIRIKRVMERSGLSGEAVRLRMRAQRSQEDYQSLAAFTIDNSGSKEELEQQVEAFLLQVAPSAK